MLTLLLSCSEKKIDDIADAVDDIKLLLKDLSPSSKEKETKSSFCSSEKNAVNVYPSKLRTQDFGAVQDEAPLRDHSVHFSRFVQDIVEDSNSASHHSESNVAFVSLRHFTQTRDASNPSHELSFPATESNTPKDDGRMPPLSDAVHVLRWAKGEVAAYLNVGQLSLRNHLRPSEILQSIMGSKDTSA